MNRVSKQRQPVRMTWSSLPHQGGENSHSSNQIDPIESFTSFWEWTDIYVSL